MEQALTTSVKEVLIYAKTPERMSRPVLSRHPETPRLVKCLPTTQYRRYEFRRFRWSSAKEEEVLYRKIGYPRLGASTRAVTTKRSRRVFVSRRQYRPGRGLSRPRRFKYSSRSKWTPSYRVQRPYASRL